MDYFNGNDTGENFSLQDMIECDIRSNFQEGNMSVGDILGNTNFEPHLSVTVGEMASIFDSPIYSLGMSDSKSVFNSYELGQSTDLQWLQSVNLTSVQDLCRPENTDPNLMVNPQTGMPTTASPELSPGSMAPNLNESAVRDALLRTPDQTTFVTVAPSQIQDQPQYVDQQEVGEHSPQDSSASSSLSQPPSSQSAIRQHLQGQVSVAQAPQSPIASYPNISSPQPMVVNSPVKTQTKTTIQNDSQKVYPKPVYSYSCLIAMALKNCETGSLPVSEIYNFMTENFPYFKTAPDGWKNSVRHNLSLNKCFEKIENPKSTGTTKKGCLWAMNPAKIEKMEEEIAKWRKKDPIAIKRSMAKPEVLDLLEQGQGGKSPRSVCVTTPTSTTPITTNNNNVITKVSTTGQPFIKQELTERPTSKLVTNISANVNVIEIKPMKMEAGGGSSGAVCREDIPQFTSEELSVLDNNLTLDPALSDLAIQNGLFGAVNGMFDDLDSNDLNLDDLPTTGSPLSFTFSSTGGLTASPIHFSAGASGAATPSMDDKSSLQSSFNLFNCSAATPTSAPATPTSTYAIARTISAQT